MMLALFSRSLLFCQAGALGIGGLLSSSLFDVSGILPASAVAITGLGILPYTRSKLKVSPITLAL